MGKLYYSFGLIFVGIALGYILQKGEQHGFYSLPVPLARLRVMLQKIAMIAIMPLCFFAAIWEITIENHRIVLLPLLCVVALVAGGVFGLLLAKLLKKSPKQKGTLFCCGSFSNIGSIGALICYTFFGEPGFALVVLYKMFEEVVYYNIGFPVARLYSDTAKSQDLKKQIIGVITDPFVSVALFALLAGITLNVLNIERPPLWGAVIVWLVPVGIFLLLVSIGLGMRFSQVGKYLKESLLISLVKFVATPLLTCSVALLLGLHNVGDGLAFKVILILSSTPVAFNSLVAASIYDLDLDLANSCWLVSTSLLLIVIPVLYLIT